MSETPMNQAAHMIVSAQSIIKDLTSQSAEVLAAIGRQTQLITDLTPVAQWETVIEEPADEPEQGPVIDTPEEMPEGTL